MAYIKQIMNRIWEFGMGYPI